MSKFFRLIEFKRQLIIKVYLKTVTCKSTMTILSILTFQWTVRVELEKEGFRERQKYAILTNVKNNSATNQQSNAELIDKWNRSGTKIKIFWIICFCFVFHASLAENVSKKNFRKKCNSSWAYRNLS
jgi:hypothetical protein